MAHPQRETTKVERLQWSGRTDRGKVRPNNEDAFLGLQFDAREVQHLGRIGEASTGKTDFAFAVSDGMGGAKAGEYASRLSFRASSRALSTSSRIAKMRSQSERRLPACVSEPGAIATG